MKNVIVGTLAVIGGITVCFATAVGVANAIHVVRERRRYNRMSPEEREAEVRRRNAAVAAVMNAFRASEGVKAEANEEVTDETTVNEAVVTA